MIATALDSIATPPIATLLGFHLIDARPQEGWIRIGFEGKREFCNPAGFIQGGILTAMLDDTMGPAVLVMTEGRLYTVGRNAMAARPGASVNSELAGVCFSPDGGTMFVNIYQPGMTLAITGPWARFRA